MACTGQEEEVPSTLPEYPRTPELEKLLTEDPYKVTVKWKKKGGKKDMTKSLYICEGTLDAPIESGQSSPSESDVEKEDKEKSEGHSSKGEKISTSEDVEEIAPP